MLQITPYALFPIISMLISIWLAFQIWSKRPGQGVVEFVVMLVGLVIWTFGMSSRLLVTDPTLKILFWQITYIGVTVVALTWMLFCLAYTGKKAWLTKRKFLLFSIEPILVQLAILTNPLHELFFTEVDFVEVGGLIIASSSPGILFWIHAIYSYVLILIGCIVLIRAMFRSPQLYRGQMTLLLVGAFTPWIANIVFLLRISPLPDFVDITPFAFVVTGLTTGWSMYRFRLMDIIPIARDVIVDNMDNAILVLNVNQQVVDANQSALAILNRPLEAVIGQSIPHILSNQDKLMHELIGKDSLEKNIQITQANKTRHYKLRVTKIRNRQNEVSGYIVSLTDFTSLQEANQDLEIANQKAREATRLKSQFLATMSHELRTPLNAIIGYTELQLAGITGELNPTQQQYQERVFSNAKHLLQLINDILDISKIEAGRMDFIRESFALQPWVDEIVRQNIVLADEKGLNFVCDINDNMPSHLIGDPGRLRQIVINLLSNAIKFTREGQVKLVVRQASKSTWTVTVIDTGIGIPSHKQETIFDEFRQVDNGSTRQYGGTGLGLAIVRKLALSMGGNIRVNSTVDEGSQFTVTLPLEPADISEVDLQKV